MSLTPWLEPPAIAQVGVYLRSYRHLLGRDLLPPDELAIQARWLFEAPFVAVSHGTEADPIFNYGNRTALTLWEMHWAQFTQLPSRYSAEPMFREERARLLADVARQGFATGYSGIRASASGRRFRIEEVTVWNLLDTHGRYCGQAATYARWTYL